MLKPSESCKFFFFSSCFYVIVVWPCQAISMPSALPSFLVLPVYFFTRDGLLLLLFLANLKMGFWDCH